MTTQTTRKILTHDFILCFFAYFAFCSASHILIPTLPIYLSKSGSTEVEIGVLIGIFSVSSLMLRPFVGRGLLRIREKTFMIAGVFLFSLTSVAYVLASPFWAFLVVRAFQGIGFAFFDTASATLIANISPEAHRGQSLSYYYLAFNISFALAPPSGMFLINHFSVTILFLVCTGLALCSLFITNKLSKRQLDPLEDLSTEDSLLFSRKALSPSIMIMFTNITWGALAAFFPLYALKHGMANPGLFFTIYGGMIILSRALGGRVLDLYSRKTVILPCFIAIIISMVILAFFKNLSIFILVAIIWGMGMAFLYPTLVAYAIDYAGRSRGPAMGTFTALGDLGIGLGPVIMGIIVHSTSYPIMFLCLALTGVINLSYFYFFVRKKG